MTDQTLIDALRRSRLATELSDAQTRTLADSLAFRDLRPDEVLVKEGTSDNHLYVIVSGALGVVRSAGTAERVTLLTLNTGDFVGELSFIDETPHYASLCGDHANARFRTRARKTRIAAGVASGYRLPGDARNRAGGARNSAADIHAVGGAHQLHLQAAREVLNTRG
jgi:hypothetical protein